MYSLKNNDQHDVYYLPSSFASMTSVQTRVTLTSTVWPYCIFKEPALEIEKGVSRVPEIDAHGGYTTDTRDSG